MSSARTLIPFAHLNLRFNPFGELTDAERVRIAVLRVAPPAIGSCVQVIAGCGRGKTAHLLAFAHALGAPYERADVTPGGRLVSPLAKLDAFVLDEAQLADRRDLAAAARVKTLVLGTHEDLAARLGGRDVLTVRLTEPPAIDVLAEIVRRRIEHARRAAGPVPSLSEGALALLLQRHGSDVRAIEGILYGAFQRLAGPVAVTEKDLSNGEV